MVDVASAKELKTKIEGYRSRLAKLRQEQAKLEERVSSSSDRYKKLEEDYTSLTGTSSVEEADAKCEAIYVELQTAVNQLEADLKKIGF